MDRGLSILGMWFAPALAIWATNEPMIAFAFLGSLLGTVMVYGSPTQPKGETPDAEG